MQSQPLNWHIIQQDDGLIIELSGILTRNTLLPLWQQRAVLFSERKQPIHKIDWNCTALTRIDSAGFALLTELLQHSKSLFPQAQIRLSHVPQQLLTLADLFGLSHWIANFTQQNG